VARLIAGIAMRSQSDEVRIERGSTLLADLYESFRRKRSAWRGEP
jgi:hypothetical protein